MFLIKISVLWLFSIISQLLLMLLLPLVGFSFMGGWGIPIGLIAGIVISSAIYYATIAYSAKLVMSQKD